MSPMTWRLFAWLRGDKTIDTLIKRPKLVFPGSDEGLQQRSAHRRQQAEQIRKEARTIETTTDDALARRRSVGDRPILVPRRGIRVVER